MEKEAGGERKQVEKKAVLMFCLAYLPPDAHTVEHIDEIQGTTLHQHVAILIWQEGSASKLNRTAGLICKLQKAIHAHIRGSWHVLQSLCITMGSLRKAN